MAMMDWIQEHPDLSLAGGAVAVLLIAGSFLKNKAPAVTTPTGDTSGLTNGIVYVPTQTSFTTNNESGIFASNDPNLQSISNTGFNTTDTTTTTTGHDCPRGYAFDGTKCVPLGIHNQPPPCAPGYARTGDGKCIKWPPPFHKPPRQPPPPGPKPPPTQGKSLKWTSTHTVQGGDTLTSLAAAQNRYNKARNGMPEHYNISWHDLYAHNTDVINRQAIAHGHRTDYWNWIFPGEVLSVPVWV